MAGIGIALRGIGRALKRGSKQRKALRKQPFGDFIDYPLEVATKHKKPFALGAVIAGASEGRKTKKKKSKEKK